MKAQPFLGRVPRRSIEGVGNVGEALFKGAGRSAMLEILKSHSASNILDLADKAEVVGAMRIMQTLDGCSPKLGGEIFDAASQVDLLAIIENDRRIQEALIDYYQ